MAGYPKAVSAMVSEEARTYIDDAAVRADTGVGDVIRRLIDAGIRAEQVTDALRRLGLLDEEDDVLSHASRAMRATLRARGRADVPTMAGGASTDPVARGVDALRRMYDDLEHRVGMRDRIDAAQHTGEPPSPPLPAPAVDGAPDAGWHPDPKVRAERARAAKRSGPDVGR